MCVLSEKDNLVHTRVGNSRTFLNITKSPNKSPCCQITNTEMHILDNTNLGIIDTAILKHKDSFGKSENLSKIFFAKIIVFDHDYEGKSSSSNGLL